MRNGRGEVVGEGEEEISGETGKGGETSAETGGEADVEGDSFFVFVESGFGDVVVVVILFRSSSSSCRATQVMIEKKILIFRKKTHEPRSCHISPYDGCNDGCARIKSQPLDSQSRQCAPDGEEDEVGNGIEFRQPSRHGIYGSCKQFLGRSSSAVEQSWYFGRVCRISRTEVL